MAILHPADARAARAPSRATRVELHNDLGTFGRGSASPTRSPRASRWFPGSARPARPLSGTVNHLCDDRLSDLGEGATYQSTFLDVRRAG